MSHPSSQRPRTLWGKCWACRVESVTFLVSSRFPRLLSKNQGAWSSSVSSPGFSFLPLLLCPEKRGLVTKKQGPGYWEDGGFNLFAIAGTVNCVSPPTQ